MKLSYGWVIVGAGMLLTCLGIGSMMSLAVFLEPMERAQGWSRTEISFVSTINFLCMSLGAFMWGTLSDRLGTRPVVTIGSVLLASGLILASRAESLWQFQLLFGPIVGLAVGSFYAPMTAAATAWIVHRRALAVALVSAGMGMGSLVVAPFATWMIVATDWRTAMLVVGCCAFALMLPTTFLVRRPPALAAGQGVAGDDGYTLTAAQAIRTPQFIAIALTHFCCCAAHSGPIFHMVGNAIGCGISKVAAAGAFGLMGFSGLGGRLGFGLLADRFGAKPILVGGLMLQAIGASLFLFVSELPHFYIVGIIFGFAYGGVMPLYALLVREYFGPRIMGTVFGAVSMAAGLGMAIGPWAGGYVYDQLASYDWLYIGSFGIGLGAVAIALTFRPLPREPQAGLAGVSAR